MMIQKWHRLAVISNLAFLCLMIIFIYMTALDKEFDWEDKILLMWYRLGTILIVQIGWNLLLHSIPKLIPIPKKEP